MQRLKFWALLGIALVLGFLITWVDSRPTWDDAGITAGAILLTTGLLGFAAPEWAWLWALAVGGGIPAYNILAHNNYGVVLVLIIAFAGALGGAFGRKVITALSRTESGNHSQP